MQSMKLAKNLLLDMFRGRLITNVNLKARRAAAAAGGIAAAAL
jgi:hypothetical protein